MLALTILVAGCSTPTPRTSPFKVSKEEIRNRVKVVAVAPLPVEDELPNDSQAREEFATLLITELNNLGFQTVPPAEYEQIFNRLRDEVGGFFDPITGKADKDKYKKVQDLCRRELATKSHADAILYSSLETFSVRFANDFAAWDGTKESVTDASWVWRALGGTHYGNVTALSVCVALTDTEGNRLYGKCGGVQLLAKTSGGSFSKIPESKVLTDSVRNANAVRYTLEPLREGTEVQGQPKMQ